MNKIFFVLIVIVTVSCKEISFKEAQPKGKRALTEMPQSLRGKYLLIEESGNNKDTLVITRKGYHVTGDSTKGELGDSLILKKYKGYYFFNDNENPEWLLRVVKREANGDLLYLFMDAGEKPFNQYVHELNKEIQIDSFEVKGKTLYQIDPTPRQLVNLIKKGYFKKTMRLTKVR
jgi:hypothetical protein